MAINLMHGVDFNLWKPGYTPLIDTRRYHDKLPWSFNDLNGLAVKRQRIRAHLWNLIKVLVTNGQYLEVYRICQDRHK